MKHLPLMLALGLMLTASPAAGRKRQPAPQQIPILAWYSIPPGVFATQEHYQELRDAGFTHSFSHTYKYDDAIQALDRCAKVGLKCVFMCSEL